VEWLRLGVAEQGARGGPFIGGRGGEGGEVAHAGDACRGGGNGAQCDGMARAEGGDGIAQGRRKGHVKGKCALGPFLSILVIECQHKWSCVNLCQVMDKVKINIKVCF
jgi:hypothetical protein